MQKPTIFGVQEGDADDRSTNRSPGRNPGALQHPGEIRGLVGILGYPFSQETLPLMEAVFREVLRAGGHPYPYFEVRYTEGLDRILYAEGSDEQLRYLEPRAEQFNLYLKRAAAGALRWAIALMPTCAYALDAEMSLREFSDVDLSFSVRGRTLANSGRKPSNTRRPGG